MRLPHILNSFFLPRYTQVLAFALALITLLVSFAGGHVQAGRWLSGGKAALTAKVNARPASPVREEIARKLKTQSKVKVELFVMSKCPFGVRAEEAISPVLDEFGKQVDFQLRFIAAPSSDGFASLHGQPEVDEDIRQVVMAQQFPEQYFDYVVARAANYRSGEWQPVAAAAGIDVSTVERLARSEAAKRLFTENIRRANELRISASPTILLDGEKYRGRILPLAPGAASAKTVSPAAKSAAAQPLPTPRPGTWQVPAWQNWFSPFWAKASAAVQSGLSGLGLAHVSSVNNSRTAGSTGLVAPAITATKSATLPNTGCPGNGLFDRNCNGLVNPGDTLMYSVLLNNTGTDALNVVFTDVLNTNLTFVPGSLSATPLARNDGYTTAFNKQLEVAGAQTVSGAVFVNGSVRNNDIDPRGGALMITPLNDSATTQGGTVMLSSTGTFLYTPPNDFVGADTFSYTATNAQGKMDTALVSIQVEPLCQPNGTRACYSGPAGTQGVGACQAGTETCNAQGTAWGPCTGEVLPSAETCTSPVDDDCDGQINEGGAGCVCQPGSTTACYSGPAGTLGVGVCQAGTRTCNAQGTAYGACVGEVLPAPSELCNTPADDNCNGQVNEGCPVCGNGAKEGSEQCDDGNTVNNDGCSASCQYETTGELEPNSSCATASGPFDIPTHAFGRLLSGSVTPAGDVDFYSFTIPTYADVQFETFDATGPGSCALPIDTRIELFAADCTTVFASNDNGGLNNACSRIIQTRLAPGTYFLKVSSANPLTSFNYTLQARYLALCGDGVKEGAEECDGGAGCDATCALIPVCGNGIKQAGEQCDDHNTTSGDGCSAVCSVEGGYSCNGTPSVCTTTCGDGIRAGAEACDDGNTANGDGCSSTCQLEACPVNRANCDNNSANGCEVNTSTDPNNCGACGVSANDGNQCTSDSCQSGTRINTPLSAGTPCNQNGGSVCDGAGACVQCVTASQCPGVDTECQTRTCNAGTCGFNFTAAGTPVVSQTPGDCKQSQCNGAGSTISVNNDADLPNDGNQCTLDVCANGVPSNPPYAAGTPCNQNGGSVCDGLGSCVSEEAGNQAAVQSGAASGGFFAQAGQWLRMVFTAFSNSFSYVKLEDAFSPTAVAASLPSEGGHPTPARTLLVNSKGESAFVPTAALPKSFNGETITVNGNGSGFTLPAGESTTVMFNATISSSFTGTSISNQAAVSGANFAALTSNNLTTQVFQAPVINGNTLPVKAGSSAASFTIATAFDPDQAAHTLGIAINGNPTMASSNGVMVSDLAITPSGTVTAKIATTCAATSATFNLVVTDSQSALGTGTLTVMVTPNTPPSLSYNPTTVTPGATPLINPATGPSDNGAINVLVLQSVVPNNGGLTVSVNAAGQVQVLSATLAGSFTVNLAVTDECNATAFVPLTINVGCPTSTFNPATLPNGVQGTLYTQTLTVTPAGGNYSYVLATGALPPGLLLASNGTLSGTPTAGGNYAFAVKATGWGTCAKTQSYNLLVTGTCAALTLDPATLPSATLGTMYNQSLTINPAGTYTFAVTQGALPNGLTLVANTGVLSGMPTTGGTFSFRIAATHAGGCTGSRNYVMTVSCGTLNFTPLTLPNGTRGAAYSQQLAVNSAGNATFSLLLGSLPPGFTLSSAGLLSGTTAQAGTYNFTAKALAGSCQGTKAYALVIGGGTAALALSGDYDGDGVSDLTLWSAAGGVWRIIKSSTTQALTQSWGTTGDVTLLGDYDGDGKSDLAVFRPADATFYVKRSRDGGYFAKAWGVATDVPVPGDYDGDGQTDIAVWRGTTGTWYIVRSSDGQFDVQTWGSASAPYHDVPVAGDYDGDGKTDIAVFRRGNGTWLVKRSSDGQYVVKQWGLGTDVPVAQDYDGDGQTDIAVWRAGLWYIWQSATNAYRVTEWGTVGDRAAAGDYDGDGQADVAVWRTTEQTWYIRESGTQRTRLWVQGKMADVPVSVNVR